MITTNERLSGRAVPLQARYDLWLLASAAVLVLVGMMALYSVGAADHDTSLFKKQAVLTTAGLVPFFIFLLVDPGFWRKTAGWLYMINLGFLTLVLVKGQTLNGAKRWVTLAGYQFQPSEIAKLLVILTLAAFFASRMEDIKRLSTFIRSLIYISPPLLLIFKQPHLGSTLVILVAWAGISICAGVPWRYILGFTLALVIGGFLGLQTGILHDYQLKRLIGGDEYQQVQAEVAIGIGGVSGAGYLKGSQKTQVPEHHNDFIFTVVGEEGGLIGSTLILAAFAFFFYRAWLVLFNGEDPYNRMVAAGILSVLGFHTVVNLGMNLNLLPVVGLWLPFLSYGNTAMWLCLCCVALLLNLGKKEQAMRLS